MTTAKFDIETIKNAAKGRWPEILRTHAPELSNALDANRRHVRCPLPDHEDHNPSFRIDKPDAGRAICTCGNYDGFELLQKLKGWNFGQTIREVTEFLGLSSTGNGQHRQPCDLLQIVCRLKRMPIESAKAYGAHIDNRGKLDVVRFPVCNSAGKVHSYFDLAADDGKGWFKKGSGMSGMFVPDGPRLPAAGETWILCEGVKDATAYHSLGFLACGLNTDRMNAKYARLFCGCHVIIMPDRTVDAETKAKRSSAALSGVAASVRIGVLPLEIGGDKNDARDVLAMPDGEQQLRQAIEDAIPYLPSMPGCRPKIVVDPQTTPVADTLGRITDHLMAARDCFLRADQLVLVNEGDIIAILTSAELAGLLSQHAEFFFGNEQKAEYKPLPTTYGNTWLHNRVERNRLPKIKLFTRNPVFAGRRFN